MRHDRRNSRKTQCERLLQLFLEACSNKSEVPLPQILDLKISQFGARLKELRALGFNIENRQETRDGKRLSFYRLVPNALTPTASAGANNPETKKNPGPGITNAPKETLFGDLRPWRDPEER